MGKRRWTEEEDMKMKSFIDQGSTPAKIFKEGSFGNDRDKSSIQCRYNKIKRERKIEGEEGKATPSNKGKNFFISISYQFTVQDLLQKFATPLSLMGKGTFKQGETLVGHIPAISAVPVIPESAKLDTQLIDEVYCWWFEHPETGRTHICIRKVLGATFDIKLVSETSISVVAHVNLSEEDVHATATAISLSAEIVGYHLRRIEQTKETIIDLQHSLINQPVTSLNNNVLIVVSYPMKSNNSLKFE